MYKTCGNFNYTKWKKTQFLTLHNYFSTFVAVNMSTRMQDFLAFNLLLDRFPEILYSCNTKNDDLLIATNVQKSWCIIKNCVFFHFLGLKFPQVLYISSGQSYEKKNLFLIWAPMSGGSYLKLKIDLPLKYPYTLTICSTSNLKFMTWPLLEPLNCEEGGWWSRMYFYIEIVW